MSYGSKWFILTDRYLCYVDKPFPINLKNGILSSYMFNEEETENQGEN